MVGRVQASLEPLRDPVRAAPMAAYMKHHFAFLGVPMPARVAALKPLWQGWQPTSSELMRLVRDLWALPEREYQYAALGALERHWKRLEARDLEPLCDLVATSKPWWDTIDVVAAHVAGGMVKRDSSLVALMDDHSAHPNLWLRRIAILHQLHRKLETDDARLFRYAIVNSSHESFWIRKALGWALREYAKVAPNAVLGFFEQHQEQFSRLTMREALKHLSR
jgi:3-methyladenine DNA glycosylase AlkD